MLTAKQAFIRSFPAIFFVAGELTKFLSLWRDEREDVGELATARAPRFDSWNLRRVCEEQERKQKRDEAVSQGAHVSR